jgi:transcriptional regulator GlxA family with amidase domain
MLWEWHRDGQAAFQVFGPPTDRGDAAVLAAQRGIAEQFAVAASVEEMVRWSGLAARTFKRRFKAATGLAPGAYRQRFRIPRCRRRREVRRLTVPLLARGVAGSGAGRCPSTHLDEAPAVPPLTPGAPHMTVRRCATW